MSELARVLRDVGTSLDEAGTAWALVGGLAVSARSEPRFTRDIDLALSVTTDAEAEAITRALSAIGLRPVTVLESTCTGRLATVRLLGPNAGGIYVDLLFASSGIEPEIAAAAEPVEAFSGLVVPVAQLGHLVACKLLSVDDRRFQDRQDLRAMRGVARPADLDHARQAVGWIKARGFHRGRDLDQALFDWIADP